MAVLGASDYTYAEATWTQGLADWIGAHTRAFGFFEGMPALVVPDNLRSGVNKACRYEPLLNTDWIRAHHNLQLTGPTGTGKSWLACALGQQACPQGLSVRYERVARLMETLRIARDYGSYHKRLATFAKADLLILDDFVLKPLTQAERLDLLELIDDRHGRRSTLVTSQLPIAHWHTYLGEDPTVADALLDRLLSAAHRLELKG